MNSKLQDFLNDLFKGKDYSWILDLTTNTLYFRPKEILLDAGYTVRGIEDKVLNLDTSCKRKFTNADLQAGTILSHILNPINNSGQYWINKNGISDILATSRKIPVKKKHEIISFFNIEGLKLPNYKEIEFIDQLEKALAPFDIKGKKQYIVLSYKIDYYIPSLNIAIEYDENEHKNYSYQAHEGRQQEIEKELGCRFIRVSDKNTNSYNIGLVIKNIFNIQAI